MDIKKTEVEEQLIQGQENASTVNQEDNRTKAVIFMNFNLFFGVLAEVLIKDNSLEGVHSTDILFLRGTLFTIVALV